MIKDALESIANAIRKGNMILEKSQPTHYSGKEIFDALIDIEVDSSELTISYLFLVENQKEDESFL